jgi:hypothetical protein
MQLYRYCEPRVAIARRLSLKLHLPLPCPMCLCLGLSGVSSGTQAPVMCWVRPCLTGSPHAGSLVISCHHLLGASAQQRSLVTDVEGARAG